MLFTACFSIWYLKSLAAVLTLIILPRVQRFLSKKMFFKKYQDMLRLSLTVILILPTVSGCMSTTKPSAVFTAQVENELTDPSAIQNAKAQAAQSRVDFQQRQQNSGNQYAVQPYDSSGYVQGQFIPASGPPEGIQSGVIPVNDTSFEVSPNDEKPAEKLTYARLPNIRVVGTIAVPDGAKVLIQRDKEDSIIRRVGEEIVYAGEKYSIKKITESGEVILESSNAQFFSIR